MLDTGAHKNGAKARPRPSKGKNAMSQKLEVEYWSDIFSVWADADIKVSRTFNVIEGRQRPSGSVGYRIIAANIRELTEPAALLQAWC